jgi:periodic tryptophan protein 2
VFSLESIEGYKPFTLAGHKESVLGVFFTEFGPLDDTRLITISKDGAVFKWRYEREAETGVGEENGEKALPAFTGGKWVLGAKHFFNQRGARVSAVAYHPGMKLLVAGFTSGVFDLLQMPDFSVIHALSISRERITSAAFNASGSWLALGCAKLGQLLVWEWKSESYVLKQQGHYFDIAACDFSPDGAYIATGADDCKVPPPPPFI